LTWPATGIALDSSSLLNALLASAPCLPRSRAASSGFPADVAASLGAATTSAFIADAVSGCGDGAGGLSRGRSHPARRHTALSAIVVPSSAQRDTLRPSAEQSRDQRYYKQDQENEEQHFRDFSGTCGNTAESEYGGDQRNDKKYQRIVKHL
jgi:hypothetical protein